MAATDLGWLDAVALRDLVAAGEVTAAEVAEGAIARIEAADPVLNAVVVPLPDIGRAIAADPALPHGPFYGVPFLLKGAGACLAGLPLYMGNGLLRSLDWRAPSDTILGARFGCGGRPDGGHGARQRTVSPRADLPRRPDPRRPVDGVLDVLLGHGGDEPR